MILIYKQLKLNLYYNSKINCSLDIFILGFWSQNYFKNISLRENVVVRHLAYWEFKKSIDY